MSLVIRNLSKINKVDYYEVISVDQSTVNSVTKLNDLCNELNVDKRGGFHIFPVKDSYGNYVYYHYENRMVLCLVCGYW